MKNIIKVTMIVLITSLVLSESMLAIPAFARKYRMSCTTCHNVFPRLKAYGNDFAGNAYQLEDKEAPRYYVDTGDDELSLIRDLPLAIRLEGHVTYRTDEDEKSDFQTPYLLKLMSGGSIAKDIGYYFYFYMDERGDVAGVEDAFIMFNNNFGTELDIYLGQFQVSDAMFKREARLTLEDYQIYKQRVGYSNFDLTYDRGLMLTKGFYQGNGVTFMVVNGNGIGGADEKRNFDNDIFKNFFLNFSQDITDNFRLGIFGYMAKEELEKPESAGSPAERFTNKPWMAGADLTLSPNENFEINAQYVYRKDSQAFPESMGEGFKDLMTNGGFAEVIYAPEGSLSKWYIAGIVNWVESDYKEINYLTIAGHYGYLVRRNLRLVGEYRYDIEKKANYISVGFVSAF